MLKAETASFAARKSNVGLFAVGGRRTVAIKQSTVAMSRYRCDGDGLMQTGVTELRRPHVNIVAV